MRSDKLITFFLSWVLSSFLAFGVAGCVGSGFSLPVQNPGAILVLFCLGSCLCAFLWLQRNGTIGIACLAALCLGFLSQPGPARQQILSFLYRISCVYDRAYGWGQLPLSHISPQPADIPLSLIGLGTILATTRSLCRGRSVLPPMVTVLVPFSLCMVVTNTVPEEGYLFPVLTAGSLLVLTGMVRQNSLREGNRLTMMLLLPVLTFYFCLFAAIPRDSYANQSKDLFTRLQTLLSDFHPQLERPISFSFREAPALDLSQAGPQSVSQETVMEVTASFTGTLYLRERIFDTYTGTGWEPAEEGTYFPGNRDAQETLHIRCTAVCPMLYYPCYPAEDVFLQAGMVPNTESLREYTILCNPQPEGIAAPLSGNDRLRFTALPAETREGALALLSGAMPENAALEEQVPAIGQFVKNSAGYDLNTPAMPEATADFALWFLRESDTGYCVHFATAATVLLRAAGIPARYVTGYLAQGKAGQPVTVTAAQAHGWAEYYDSTQGLWRVLEATPGYAAETSESPPGPPETRPAPVPPVQGAEDSLASTPQKELPGWPLLLLLLPLPELLRLLRRKGRKARLSKGSPNEQALQRWQLICRLSPLLSQPIPEGLEKLTLKARFSQHILTGEELDQYDAWFRSARQKQKTLPWYRQLWHRYRHAI